MAYLLADKLVVRLRELLQSGYGSVRAISSTRFRDGHVSGLAVEELRRRGITSEKPIGIHFTAVRPHPQRIARAGDVQLWSLDATITVVRTVSVGDQVTTAQLDALEAAAVIDSTAIADVLEWPGNLAQTEGALATDVQGCTYLGMTTSIGGTTGGAQDHVTQHKVSFTAISRPSTT